MMKTEEILTTLTAMFPDAHCELNHRNPFELAVAVVLSAQTTDAAVNRIGSGAQRSVRQEISGTESRTISGYLLP